MTTPRMRIGGLLRVAVPLIVAAITIAALRPATQTGHATSLGVSSGKLLLMTAGPPTDTVAPQLTTLQMFDTDFNGKVDRVVATFNEALAAYTAGTTGWTLANVPSGGSLASVAVSGTAATLTLNEGAGAQNTAVGSFTVALAATTNGVRDAAGNRSSFAATAPADKAGPVPVNVATTKAGGTAGQMELGDQLAIAFSEPIATASLPAGSVTVTEADPAGQPKDDSLTIPGVTNGALLMGDTKYINANAANSTAPATVTYQATGVGGLPTVFVDLTPTCNCGSAKVGQGPFTFIPSTTITDAAGNVAAGSFTTIATFRIF